MTFAQYCDMVESTEQEQQLLDYMRSSDDFNQLDEVVEKLKFIPIAGKVLVALSALGKVESIAEFRQTQHYRHLMNWEFTFDNGISLSPGEVHRKKALKVLAVIGVVLGFLLLRRILRCKK